MGHFKAKFGRFYNTEYNRGWAMKVIWWREVHRAIFVRKQEYRKEVFSPQRSTSWSPKPPCSTLGGQNLPGDSHWSSPLRKQGEVRQVVNSMMLTGIRFCSSPCAARDSCPLELWEWKAEAATKGPAPACCKMRPLQEGQVRGWIQKIFPDMISGIFRAINLLLWKAPIYFNFFLTLLLLSLRNAETTLIYCVHPSEE